MIPVELMAIFFGLASAVSWGAGDFIGGCASRRTNVYSVVLVTQIVGVVFFPILAFVFSENLPPLSKLLWGCLAGFFGTSGLLALYQGLAEGKMGIVAPVAAVISAIVPVIYSAFYEGFPEILRIAGFIFAFIAVWFIVSMDNGPKVKINDLKYPLLAGMGFGLFFISIDNFSETAVFWPLAFARGIALLMFLGFVVLTGSAKVKPSSIDVLPVIVLAGLFNTGGCTFFALASEAGRLDITTILSSLSPGATVLLAYFILKEKLAPRQWLGVVSALFAIILMSI
ncbi:DMT family transporter [Methanohalophilus sp. RSK]|uniref:DMT family transporter n=1 Tax=Methanohalophilus sp. RSK TaxID=2485783 RepID=UPI000F43BACB|nr:DMT family transporter [Methanohalophilus sp. RSK]RNI12864.1 DMT family transporter [Methanohalophilus sp. RSK]